MDYTLHAEPSDLPTTIRVDPNVKVFDLVTALAYSGLTIHRDEKNRLWLREIPRLIAAERQ
jgi:hypothetical protein